VTDAPIADANADPIRDFIAQSVDQNPVVLFMKGTPDSPRCGFSSLAVQILDHLGVDFVGVDVLQDEALRNGIKAFSDWPTIPQLYVKGEFVGGSDILREMMQAGELQTLMAEKGVLGTAQA
jgi:monothiol glutaredoxin